MLISTRGRYALRVMIDLAEQQSGSYIPLKEIAQRQEISEKYLESIVKTLVHTGDVEGLRGKGGGYRLTRAPEDYAVGDLLRKMEGTLSPVACLGPESAPCSRAADCRTLPMWKRLDAIVNDYLDSVTIADLMRGPQEGNEYVI